MPVPRSASFTTWSVISPSPFRSRFSIASSITKEFRSAVWSRPSSGTGSSALRVKLPHLPPGQLASSVHVPSSFVPPRQAPSRSTTGPTPPTRRVVKSKSPGPHSLPGQSASAVQAIPAFGPLAQRGGDPRDQARGEIHGAVQQERAEEQQPVPDGEALGDDRASRSTPRRVSR